MEHGRLLCDFACFNVLDCEKKGKDEMKGFLGFPLIFAISYLLIFQLVTGMRPIRNPGLQIHVIDVGQGDGIYIEMNGKPVALIDGGADYTADPYILGKTGLGCSVPLVVLSHPHDDHFVGLRRFWERCKFVILRYNDVVLDGRVLPKNKKYFGKNSVKKTFDGEEFFINEVKIKMLVPFGNSNEMPKNINDASVATLVKYKDFEALFLGDLETEAQGRIDFGKLEKEIDGRLDVLKVAHHGAKNGLNKTLVARLKPRICAISVGADNKFGHPSPLTVETLEELGCGVIRTDKAGNVVVGTR